MMVNRQLLTAQIVGMFVVFALALFLAAGTVAWPAGWAFLVLFFGFTIALSLWLLRHNPGLLTERMTGVGKPDQKAWDKVFFVLANVVFLAWLIVMPLDAVRFRWSQLPAWLQVVGALLLLGSFLLFFLTFRENAASTAVPMPPASSPTARRRLISLGRSNASPRSWSSIVSSSSSLTSAPLDAVVGGSTVAPHARGSLREV